MNEKLTIYYSVENGGDGSAYPLFFVDEDVAEYHQENLDEGWGESCTGSITFEGNNLSCLEAKTKEGYYLDLLLDLFLDLDDENKNKIQKFVSKFFPEGVPKFDVNILNNNYYGVLFKDKVVHKEFSYPHHTTEKGCLSLKKKINKKKVQHE